MRGLTDGERLIILRPGLSRVEERCTLTHELVHLHYGHRAHQEARAERHVRDVTARLLIPVTLLEDGLAWTQDVHELAEHLEVTPQVLRDRLAHADARALMWRTQN